jgi:hypothetical protein
MLTSIVGSIFTIAISKVFLVWLGSQLNVIPEHWVADFFGFAERGVTDYPVTSIFIHGCACLIVLIIGIFIYRISGIIFGLEANVVRRRSSNGRVVRSQKNRILKIIVHKALLVILLLPKLLILFVLNLLNILFPDFRLPRQLLLKILRPKKRPQKGMSPNHYPTREPVPKKLFLPTHFPKTQLNDWRANLNTIKTLRANSNGESRVRIHYTDIRNYLFAERLALAFRESGWKVYFRRNAHEKNFPVYNGRVEVSGDDKKLVQSIASVLEVSGCVSVSKTIIGKKLDYFQSITHTYYHSEKKDLQKEIVVTIGYQGLQLSTVA